MKSDTRNGLALGLASLVFGGLLSGCVSRVEPSRTVPAGLPHPDPPDLAFPEHGLGDDSVVRVVTPHVGCTGTLIAADRVLTAHHCLSVRNQYGDYLSEDVEPDEVHVQLGGDFLNWGEVGVRAIVSPSCGYSAGVGDIAILVLSSSIDDVPFKEVALEQQPRAGLEVSPLGFGRCADSSEGIRLRTREGGRVDRVKSTSFQLEAAICPGDSGGPGVDDEGQVVGVVSASALDARQNTRSRTEFTRVDRWHDVFANALRISEGANPAELPPISGCPEEDE